MHIHAGFGDADSRIRVMTAMRRYLPLLHAVSTSSPFNAGRETGFKSYRLSIIGALPRTGLPGPLWSRAEFDQLVADYQRMKLIGDGSELWWDIRPSVRFPTIELRICDLCPRIGDAMCIAALYACLIRRLSRLDREGALPAEPPTEIINENRWLAQRYGILAFLGDTSEGGRKDIEDSAAELVEELADDARALGCEQELRHTLTIIREGTGADRQIDLFRLRRVEGDTDHQALRAVVDLVIEETREGSRGGDLRSSAIPYLSPQSLCCSVVPMDSRRVSHTPNRGHSARIAVKPIFVARGGPSTTFRYRGMTFTILLLGAVWMWSLISSGLANCERMFHSDRTDSSETPSISANASKFENNRLSNSCCCT